MNRISVIVLMAILFVSLLLMGVSCTKKENDPDNITEEPKHEVNAEIKDSEKNDSDATEESEESKDIAPSDTTVNGETVGGSKDESNETVKQDNVIKETSSETDIKETLSDKDSKETSSDNDPEETSIDKDSKETSSHNDSKDTEKTPDSSSVTSNDTEKSDKETAYKPEPMTYKEFISLSPFDQQAYFEKFEDIEDYMKWYNDALDEYEKEQNKEEIDGTIDLGEIINGGN